MWKFDEFVWVFHLSQKITAVQAQQAAAPVMADYTKQLLRHVNPVTLCGEAVACDLLDFEEVQ